MASLFNKYEGPRINAALIWSTIKSLDVKGKGVTKEEIIKAIKKEYGKEVWNWVEKEVSNSIETALRTGLIRARFFANKI